MNENNQKEIPVKMDKFALRHENDGPDNVQAKLTPYSLKISYCYI